MSKNYAGGLLTANQNANFSGLFNGSNSNLSVAGASRFAIATSTTPFTIEAWVRPTVAGGIVFAEEYTGPGDPIAIVCSLATSNVVEAPSGLFPAFGFYTTAPLWVTAASSTTALVLNAWSHLAFVFTGSTSRIYINGIDVTRTSSPTPATTWGVTGNNGNNWFIGRRWDTGGANVYFKGNISNVRFVNGTAVYTGNFAPPARLSAITNTVLLACQSSTFIDTSSFRANITNTGGVVISQDNPFYTQPYDPSLGAATPGVWTISEAAAAAGNRSWNMYDPYFNVNTAMVHGNGVNNANNNTFLDSSTNNFTITRNGNTTQGTFTPFSEPEGYWSNLFGSTTGYISAGTNTAFAFGTGNFTLEAWINMSVLPASGGVAGNIICTHNWTGGLINFTFRVNATTGFLFFEALGGANTTGNRAVPVGRWVHVACVRISGVITFYIDGTNSGGGTVATNLTSTVPLTIGHSFGGGSFGAFTGYISNARVIKGTAVYTSNFTPSPAPLTAVTNTSLLTCQSSRFKDNSSNNFTITSFGDARTLTFSPLYSPTAYTPQTRGGAMYFDGTGDFLTTPSNGWSQLGSGNFTVEAFCYITAYGGYFPVFDARTTNNFAPWIFGVNSSGFADFFYGTSAGERITDTVATGLNMWVHIAAVRNGSTITLYVNGTSRATATYSSAVNGTGPTPNIGRLLDPFFANGYISNARVVVGTAVYTANFTPPTAPLTPITNTQLLLSGTNGAFIDNATNLTIETVNAIITTSQNKYGSGSMLFNGSTAYASLITPFGNGSNVVHTLGDFTAEAWVFLITNNAQRTIFILNSNTSSYGAVRLDHNASGQVQLLVSTNGTTHAINSAAGTIPTSRWTHIAVVRAGPAFTVYLNGVSVIVSTAVGVTTAVMAGTVSYLGVLFNSAFGGYLFGAISDFRTTNYARYLSNFTPPTSTLQNQ